MGFKNIVPRNESYPVKIMETLKEKHFVNGLAVLRGYLELVSPGNPLFLGT